MQGVIIHQINMAGLMSKIQPHWFKVLESGQSWEGITAESMQTFLFQKSMIWEAYLIFFKAANVFYSVSFPFLYLPVLRAQWAFRSYAHHPSLNRGQGWKSGGKVAMLESDQKNPPKNTNVGVKRNEIVIKCITCAFADNSLPKKRTDLI